MTRSFGIRLEPRSLSLNLGTLAVGLGYSPLANGRYHPLTASRDKQLLAFGVWYGLVIW